MKRILIALTVVMAALCANAQRVARNGLIFNLTVNPGGDPVRTAVLVGTVDDYIFGDLVIPENVEYRGGLYPVIEIKNKIFFNNKTLESLTLPGSLSKIGEYAFYRCANLKNVTLSEGIVTIGGCAFQDCVALEEVKIPESVREIGSGAFGGCSSLKSIVIPEGV